MKGLETTPALISVWEEYVRDEDADWSAWETLTRAYVETGQNAKAVTAAKHMVELAPDDTHKASSLVDLSGAERAAKSANALAAATEAVRFIRQYLTTLDTRGNNRPALVLLARVLLEQRWALSDLGRWSEVTAAAKESLSSLDTNLRQPFAWPVRVNALLLLGDSSLEQKRYDEAAQFYGRAREAAEDYLKRSPEHYVFTELAAWSACGTGETALRMARLREAEESLETCEREFGQLAVMDPDLPTHKDNADHVRALLSETRARMSNE
jgi:tetratricopeptide (TPR) repeat protein